MESPVLAHGCPCGRDHLFDSDVYVGHGVLGFLPSVLAKWGSRHVFLLADETTYACAGETAETMIRDAGLRVTRFLLGKRPEPDEANVGLAFMAFDADADAVVAVGSGVVNDIGKIVASRTGLRYAIVATAPSMDGYASATSSVTREGLKVSLPSKAADVIIGDTAILSRAPTEMMLAGLGDMLAKYVSIAEWRISHLVTGEYYCEAVASAVRASLAECLANADGLLSHEEKAVEAVFRGLVLCGAAMKYAGLSRPASGVEHYLSHIWDMRGASFGTKTSFHGTQCALGTLIAVEAYERLLAITPDRALALSRFGEFDYPAWAEKLRAFLGRGADAMIALEEKERKYDPAAHEKRLDVILAHWNEIVSIVGEELPSSASLRALYRRLGLPCTPDEIGIDPAILPMTFYATKDIRDKYVLSRLAMDLGVMEELI